MGNVETAKGDNAAQTAGPDAPGGGKVPSQRKQFNTNYTGADGERATAYARLRGKGNTAEAFIQIRKKNADGKTSSQVYARKEYASIDEAIQARGALEQQLEAKGWTRRKAAGGFGRPTSLDLSELPGPSAATAAPKAAPTAPAAAPSRKR